MDTFKRNNEVVGKVDAILENGNLTDEEKQTILKMKKAYENATYKDYRDRHMFFADMVSDMTNDFAFDDEIVAQKMANEHPTLQQSFMRFVLKFIKKMSEKTYYDGRNERAVKMAKTMTQSLSDEYLPCI